MENGTITMETDKLEKIQDVEPPTTKKQVRAFIGLVGILQEIHPKFCRNCSPSYQSHKERSANESHLGTGTAARIQCSMESAEQSPYTSPTRF